MSNGEGRVLNRVAKGLVGVILATAICLAQTSPAPQKKVKDQAEYDLYASIQKETDPTKKLGLLDQWTDKYPETDFKQERNLFYAQTYAGIAAQAQQPNATPDQLAAAEKAAHTLIDKADTFFAPEMKMSNLTDDAWTKAKTAVLLQAHQALAAAAVAKKDWPAAEQEYTKMLEANPNDAATSYLLGTAIASEKKVERTPEAIYHFTRAAVLTGPGALAPAGQQQTDAYVKKVYTGYHGDLKGLDDVKAAAAKSPMPPPGFTIESVTDISKKENQNEEQFNKNHPDILLWRNIRTELTGPGGDAYFNKNMKGTEVPNLKGKVVAQPNQKELTIAVDNVTPETMTKPEATLVFDSPLKGTVDPGTELTFIGSPKSYTKDPYMITFDVEKKNVNGLGAAAGPATPAPTHRAPVRRRK
ncbi:MAG: hypothetical protein M3Z09_17245 [Acidobacteriota bacterium]|nr:hypothetical protein [Acidobacteriota bacterium]